MNIFYLDQRPDICARYHNDKHVIKMALESTQLLFLAYHDLASKQAAAGEQVTAYEGLPKVYKPAHANHPCGLWARDNGNNWWWLWSLAMCLCVEYTYRFKKVHACHEILNAMQLKPPLQSETNPEVITERPRCFGPFQEELAHIEDTLEAYREYYRRAKGHLNTYTRREPPKWL
jgi:hypothetical protein